jgi:hypothetical protein
MTATVTNLGRHKSGTTHEDVGGVTACGLPVLPTWDRLRWPVTCKVCVRVRRVARTARRVALAAEVSA